MKIFNVAILAAAVVLPITFAAAGPMKGHPNLVKAQNDINNAWTHITASQEAHEFDAGGHAEKAKAALSTAKDEVKLAAESENKNDAKK